MKPSFVLLLFFVFSINLHGTELEQAEALTEDAVANEFIPLDAEKKSENIVDSKSLDYLKLYGGPALSTFVGFGTGVGIQGNYLNRGLVYGAIDSVGTAALFYATIECNTQAKEIREGRRPPGECEIDPAVESAFGLMLISRVAQILETTIWSLKYYYQYKTTAFILPTEDGTALSFMIEF